MVARKNPHAQDPRRWYSRAEWKRLARAQLRRQPLCAMCAAAGWASAATVADHIVPVFDADGVACHERFRLGALQSLCRDCHDRVKRRVERRGYDDTIGEDGLPTDPRHPFNASSRSKPTQ
jgi:5-methylcytosine-specific restriction endonuclease McrA